MIMSWLGMVTGRPSEGLRMLLLDSMRMRASACASAPAQVDGHLVAVEVGVEGAAHERVQLDGLALDELGLEGLDAQAVQGGGSVEQHGVLADDLGQDAQTLGLARSTMRLAALTFWASVELDEPLS